MLGQNKILLYICEVCLPLEVESRSVYAILEHCEICVISAVTETFKMPESRDLTVNYRKSILT